MRFFDTNVLVYAATRQDARKQEIAMWLLRHALVVREECQLSHWDALIVAAAEISHCHEIVTEDLNDGRLYRGMVAVNPF